MDTEEFSQNLRKKYNENEVDNLIFYATMLKDMLSCLGIRRNLTPSNKLDVVKILAHLELTEFNALKEQEENEIRDLLE